MCSGDKGGKPNILLITADDLGLQLGCYGDSVAQSPHIDSLAASALRFTNAYVTHGSCSPSRASMLTGLFSHQHGLEGLAHLGYRMKPNLPTLFDITKRAGYRTGLVGKNHVAGRFEGCDLEISTEQLDGGKGVDKYATECARLFAEKCSGPFFYMVNYTDPHAPFKRQVNGLPEAPVMPEQVAPFPFQGIDTPALRERIAGYYNNLKRFDIGIGLLLEVLEQAGHSQDTVVILASDQGPPFARSKTTVYEAGIKIPLIVRWPGVTPVGGVAEQLVSTVDLYPTFCELAGGCGNIEHLPGASLVPILAGRATEWRDSLFAEYGSHGVGNFYPRRSVRDKRYKLILNLLSPRTNPVRSMDGNGSWQASRAPQYDGTQVREVFDRYANPPAVELYDLERDPVEFYNLADDVALIEAKRRLMADLEQWRSSTDDPYLDPAKLHAMTEQHDRLMRAKAERYTPIDEPSEAEKSD